MEDILNILYCTWRGVGDWHFLSIGGNDTPQRMHGNTHGFRQTTDLFTNHDYDQTAKSYNNIQLNIQ